MLSYYRTMQWHEERDKEEVKDADTGNLFLNNLITQSCYVIKDPPALYTCPNAWICLKHGFFKFFLLKGTFVSYFVQ